MKNYIDSYSMANANCSNILSFIRRHRSVSRKEITENIGLSWGGMTKIVNKLLENGYIIEEKTETKRSSGRTPSLLSVNTKRNFVIGLDINKIGLKATVLDLAGTTLKQFDESMISSDRDGVLSEIISFTKKIFDSFPKNSIISIGVAMQGIVEYKKGISVNFPVSGWKDVPVKELLEKEFHVSVFLEHDPDCLLYPYMQQHTKENIILLRVDNSIGMAAAIGEKIIKGKGLLEIAHNIVIPNGKACHCGQKGCLEAYISGCIEDNKLHPERIDELSAALAIVLKNVTNIFNADHIILTGEWVCEELFHDKLSAELHRLGCDAKLQFSTFSDTAAKGAALIASTLSINSLTIES